MNSDGVADAVVEEADAAEIWRLLREHGFVKAGENRPRGRRADRPVHFPWHSGLATVLIRCSHKPFASIRLVLSGDFLDLPGSSV